MEPARPEHGRQPTASATWRSAANRPVVGITCDLITHNETLRSAAPVTYAHAVARAGGLPVLLQPITELALDCLLRCDAVVLTGGDDPRTEPFGTPTHDKTDPVNPDRQSFESALIEGLEARFPDRPVLGVCLGMQMMALHAGGSLDQYMPETHPEAARHWQRVHPIAPKNERASPVPFEPGEVLSKHKQAVSKPGRLSVVATADDGVIEAVADPDRPFYVGVQWHPERTDNPALGQHLFNALIAAAR
jgi:putative glutamine amidotransferase